MLVLDDPEALAALLSLCEVALVGGSLVPSVDGATGPAAATVAVAGCAVLMGPYGGAQLALASELNHAAMVASEEAAAAVACTGAAAARGAAAGSMDTPREGAGTHGAAGGAGGGPEQGTPVQGGWGAMIAEAQRPGASLR